MNLCIKCGIEKNESQFAIKKYGQRLYRRNLCRDCYDASRRDHSCDQKLEGRTCNKCLAYKPISELPRQRECLYGIEPVCKACKIIRRKQYVQLYPERARAADLRYHYGISLEAYDAMLVRQAGKCAICGRADQMLVVDHNHVTGAVRSLLCHLCNAMIGCALRTRTSCYKAPRTCGLTRATVRA